MSAQPGNEADQQQGQSQEGTAEQPVKQETAAPEGKVESTEKPQGQERDEQGRFRNPVQPRLDELTRKARENEREAAYWRQRAEAREQAEKEAAAPKKPVKEDFENYDEYVEALADFKAEEKVSKRLEAEKAEQAKAREAESRQSSWAQNAAKFAQSTPDYHEVMSASDVPVAPHVIEALEDFEDGPRVAYHLAKNPDIADQLNAKSLAAAAREIGRIAATLARETATPSAQNEEEPAPARAAAPPPAPARKTTSAPPPVKPLSQGKSNTVDLTKLSGDDYVRARVQQGASWARR